MNPALRAAWRGFFGGTPDEASDKYRRASPITYVERVRAPVWICHGTDDTRTPPREALQYARALERVGGDVTIDWFSGGHETGGTAKAVRDQQRMFELVRAALRGERWSNGPVTAPQDGTT